jgi:hypothetical protein
MKLLFSSEWFAEGARACGRKSMAHSSLYGSGTVKSLIRRGESGLFTIKRGL